MPRGKRPPPAPPPPSQIRTRSENRDINPGIPDKPKPRRATAKVQSERNAKAKAKETQAVAKQCNIERTTEFEHTDMANEDLVDATPRASCAPKPWRRTRKDETAELSPVAEVSDNAYNSSDEASFAPPRSEESPTEQDAEEPSPRPALKARKAKKVRKAARRATAGLWYHPLTMSHSKRIRRKRRSRCKMR